MTPVPTKWPDVPTAEAWLLKCKAKLRELDMRMNRTTLPTDPINAPWRIRAMQDFNWYRAAKKAALTWLKYNRTPTVAQSLFNCLNNEPDSPEKAALKAALQAFISARLAEEKAQPADSKSDAAEAA